MKMKARTVLSVAVLMTAWSLGACGRVVELNVAATDAGRYDAKPYEAGHYDAARYDVGLRNEVGAPAADAGRAAQGDSGDAAGSSAAAVCGGCGHVCTSPQMCVKGHCEEVASCNGEPCQGTCNAGVCTEALFVLPSGGGMWSISNSIAVNGSGVYWAKDDPEGVLAVTLSDDGIGTIYSPDPNSHITTITSDDSSIYVSLFATSNEASGEIVRVPLCGGSATTVATAVGNVTQMAVVGSDVYWVDDSALRRASLGGGAVSTIVAAGDSSFGNFFAADSSAVYTGATAIVRTPIGGGTPVTLSQNPPTDGGFGHTLTTSIAVDASNVYWTSVDDPESLDPQRAVVMRVPIAGGTAVTIAARRSAADTIAVDATHVYWFEANPPGYRVLTVPIAGGQVATLDSSRTTVVTTGLAVTSTSVVWSDFRSLHRLTPKPR